MPLYDTLRGLVQGLDDHFRLGQEHRDIIRGSLPQGTVEIVCNHCNWRGRARSCIEHWRNEQFLADLHHLRAQVASGSLLDWVVERNPRDREFPIEGENAYRGVRPDLPAGSAREFERLHEDLHRPRGENPPAEMAPAPESMIRSIRESIGEAIRSGISHHVIGEAIGRAPFTSLHAYGRALRDHLRLHPDVIPNDNIRERLRGYVCLDCAWSADLSLAATPREALRRHSLLRNEGSTLFLTRIQLGYTDNYLDGPDTDLVQEQTRADALERMQTRAQARAQIQAAEDERVFAVLDAIGWEDVPPQDVSRLRELEELASRADATRAQFWDAARAYATSRDRNVAFDLARSCQSVFNALRRREPTRQPTRYERADVVEPARCTLGHANAQEPEASTAEQDAAEPRPSSQGIRASAQTLQGRPRNDLRAGRRPGR
jgi:hypothetical protein